MNPKDSRIDETTILFAFSSDDDAVDICAFDGEADKSTWAKLFAENRKLRFSKLSNEQKISVGNTGWLLKKLRETATIGNRVGFVKANLDIIDALHPTDAKESGKVMADKTAKAMVANVKAAKIAKENYAEMCGFGPLPSTRLLASRGDTSARSLSVRTQRLLGEPTDSVERAMCKAVRDGGHTVIVLLGKRRDSISLWRQIEIIVAIVRETHDQPIVVVAELSANLQAVSRAHNVLPGLQSGLYLIEGDPKRIQTLLKAGIETCEQFMTISPTAPPNADDGGPIDLSMMDRENLLLCGILERNLDFWYVKFYISTKMRLKLTNAGDSLFFCRPIKQSN